MSELVRTVRSGIVGLDLALGGGFRFLRRSHPGDRESSILLVRGGPGVGKSVLAGDLALRLAAAVQGDALYFCYEVLPSEVRAQRMGFDGYDASRVVDLSEKGHRDPGVEGTVLVLGMVDATKGDDGVPDIGSALLDLSRIATARGYTPKVVVVDSLSEGYGLGTSVPRDVVDGLCKLAVEQGWVLILVEETTNDSPSPWTFAVDTVLSLRLAAADVSMQSRRELLVTKHRFGNCEPGPHGLLIERERVRVIPPFTAYRNAVRDLALPSPSTGRTLAIPAVGSVTFPQWFEMADGVGGVVIIEGHDIKNLEKISNSIAPGRRSEGTGALSCSFGLFEIQLSQPLQKAGEFSVGTLHQFITGEEWLESVLSWMSILSGKCPGGISRVRIGPMQRIELYDRHDDISRAIWLIANLLQVSGMLVVVFGESVGKTVRAGIVSSVWTVKDKTKAAPVTVAASRGSFEEGFTFTPALD